MWFSQEDGSELYDFELEPGGAQEWGYQEQTEELRRTILYLVHENNSMLVKLRGLSALREVLQSLQVKQERDQAKFCESSIATLGAEKLQERTPGTYAEPLSRQTQTDENLQEDTEQVCFADDHNQKDECVHMDKLKVSLFCCRLLVKCNPIP